MKITGERFSHLENLKKICACYILYMKRALDAKKWTCIYQKELNHIRNMKGLCGVEETKSK